MIRHRLRSNNGCIQCRTRRKKCDETKPVCQACTRLRLPCYWKSSDNFVRTSLDVDMAQVICEAHTSMVHPPSLRLPDFISVRRSDQVELPDVKDFLQDTSVRDPGAHDHDPFSPRDFIVRGVRTGWHTLLDHPDTECVARIDRYIESCGHGQAARIAFCWLFYMLHICFRRWRQGGETPWSGLPHWYVPVQLQTSQNIKALCAVDFIAWPALRQRMLNQPFTYCNNQFYLRLALDGIRFIWPGSYADITTTNTGKGRFEFSDEYSMRVLNLRSFTLTKAFLDRYPEVRGDAAQLEPSITTYRLSDASIAETIFWAKMREARRKKIESKIAHTGSPPVEQAEVPPETGRD